MAYRGRRSVPECYAFFCDATAPARSSVAMQTRKVGHGFRGGEGALRTIALKAPW